MESPVVLTVQEPHTEVTDDGDSANKNDLVKVVGKNNVEELPPTPDLVVEDISAEDTGSEARKFVDQVTEAWADSSDKPTIERIQTIQEPPAAVLSEKQSVPMSRKSRSMDVRSRLSLKSGKSKKGKGKCMIL